MIQVIDRVVIKIIYVVDNDMLMLTRKKQGFSLIEMLLVMVIISVLVVMGLNYTTQKTDELRRDRAAMQYQQILNAALAYYIGTSATTWPSIATLKASGYLPNITLNNPWGNVYASTTVSNMYYVYSRIPSGNTGRLNQGTILVGRLPFAFMTTNATPNTGQLCTASSGTCYLAAGVTIPGQNLNNARSAPTCPSGTKEDVAVIPVSLLGLNDPSTPPNATVFPLVGFSAYAYGAPGTPPGSLPTVANNVADCYTPTSIRVCQQTPGTDLSGGRYWRVCLKVLTTKGDVAVTNPGWGEYATILAITRCSPTAEPEGSDFNVFTR